MVDQCTRAARSRRQRGTARPFADAAGLAIRHSSAFAVPCSLWVLERDVHAMIKMKSRFGSMPTGHEHRSNDRWYSGDPGPVSLPAS